MTRIFRVSFADRTFALRKTRLCCITMNARNLSTLAILAFVYPLAAGCGSNPAPSGASSSASVSTSVSSSSGGGGEGGGTGGTAGSGGAGGTGGAGGASNGISDLSDSFDGNSLSSDWMVFRPEVLNITVANGSLSLRLDQQALWFNDNRGPLVYKNVTGNFRVTSRVQVRKASNPAVPPTNAVHLGGLMARNPQGAMPGASENYVFIVAGFDEVDLSIETKTTVNSVSTYEGPTWPSGDAELRLCRVGSKFFLYKRALGGPSFTLAKTYDRPDLPATLQVGANVYSYMTPDLLAQFDEITFSPVASEADCSAN
jgi:hypothetical protein